MTEQEKLSAYMERLGIRSPYGADADAGLLQKIFYAHVTRIPYENISFLLRITDLSMDALFRQVVTEKRGGVCYELSTLLGWALRRLGYEVKDILCDHYRIHDEDTPRKHKGLCVKDSAGKLWWVDVGDSFSNIKSPLELKEDVIQELDGEKYRFEKMSDGRWMEWTFVKNRWIRNYAFAEKDSTMAELLMSKDAVMASDIPFMKIPMFGLRTREGMIFLKGNELHTNVNGVHSMKLCSEDEMPEAFAIFGIRYPYTVYGDTWEVQDDNNKE